MQITLTEPEAFRYKGPGKYEAQETDLDRT